MHSPTLSVHAQLLPPYTHNPHPPLTPNMRVRGGSLGARLGGADDAYDTRRVVHWIIQCTSKPCFAAPLVLRPPHFVAMRVRPGQPRVEAKRRPNRGARFFQLGFSQGPHDVR